ncbi:DUF4097 family beta strand repeat-containing protein [Alicyclobacillus sp. SO9]|uniref:DUF4097 family beta strand repeat-containing protein n=1 Tax=Alicyclobacillus sp. SO9 TaxID=2665646 RepID=UPI0018E7703A|nr:DUF4097 family beta strand repeat-containing protein [Alicyclobacillus sp. SO9]QQE78977.1 DUF4097 family beta strand repeat protein [Alicyclobacillus sp. SO9]
MMPNHDTNKVHVRKVGILTSAAALITIGVIVILHVAGPVSYSVLHYIWPAMLILFGIEAIWTYVATRGTRVRVSGWSVVLLVVIGLFSLGTYGVRVLSSDLHFGPGYAEPVNGKVAIGGGIQKVVIRLRNTPVTVTGTTSSTLSYNGVLKVTAASKKQADKDIHTQWQVHKTGDTLVMTLVEPKPRIDLSFGGLIQSSPHLNVAVPQQLLSSVTTTNSSIDESHMNGAVDLHTTNGPIKLQDIKGNVSAATTNGSIHLKNVAKTVNVSTTNGSITGNSMVGGQWTCDTTNASVKMSLQSQSNAKVTASTSNGHFGGNVKWTTSNRNNATATVGKGTYPMTIHTTNASVTIDSQS